MPTAARYAGQRDLEVQDEVNPFVFADLGNAPTFSDTRVEIEPAEPTAADR